MIKELYIIQYSNIYFCLILNKGLKKKKKEKNIMDKVNQQKKEKKGINANKHSTQINLKESPLSK